MNKRLGLLAGALVVLTTLFGQVAATNVRDLTDTLAKRNITATGTMTTATLTVTGTVNSTGANNFGDSNTDVLSSSGPVVINSASVAGTTLVVKSTTSTTGSVIAGLYNVAGTRLYKFGIDGILNIGEAAGYLLTSTKLAVAGVINATTMRVVESAGTGKALYFEHNGTDGTIRTTTLDTGSGGGISFLTWDNTNHTEGMRLNSDESSNFGSPATRSTFTATGFIASGALCLGAACSPATAQPIKVSTWTATYGSGSAHVCVNDAGVLFISEAACP